MAWLFPTKFKQRLINDMEKVDEWGQPHAERLKLEEQEEALICTLADDGTEVLRRPDIANPIHILLK